MKLIIDIPEEVLKTRYYTDYFGCGSHKLTETLDNGTPIPDNATNGDMMKVIFNCKTSNEDSNYLVKYSLDGIYEEVNSDWWNSPYQKGGKG